MARKKVIDLDASTTVGFGNNEGQVRQGKTVEGYYIGSRKVQTGMGESVLHVLQQPEGNLGVWGSAQLNAKLGSIQLGNMVFITYKGKVKVPKGTMKKFDVEYDDEDTIHVDSPQVNFTSGKDAEESNEEAPAEEEQQEEEQADESEEEQEEELEEEETQRPAPRAAAPKAAAPRATASAPKSSAVSPEQAARVKNLLSGKKA